jgi:hypothetical protein
MVRSEWPKYSVVLLAISFWIIWQHWAEPWFLLAISSGLYDPRVSDFFVFYVAGRSWLSHLNPYIVNPQCSIHCVPFVYPPASLPFFGLFGLFNFNLAAQLWTVTYLALFLAALLALAITVKGGRRFLFLSLAVLLFFASFPLQFLIELSQSDLLIASLAILSLASQRLKHEFLSAVLLGMAILLKGTPILLLVYFVAFRRDLLYLARCLASITIIVGVSMFVVPFESYWYYMVKVAPTLSEAFALTENQSIVGVLSLAGLSKATLYVSLAGFGLFALFSFYASSNNWKDFFGRNTLRADGMFLMNVLMMLFFGPRSTIYPYVWIILPSALFLSALLIEKPNLAYLALVSLATFLMNSNPYPAHLANFLFYRGVSPFILPGIIIGNMMMVISLIPIYIRPKVIFRSSKT